MTRKKSPGELPTPRDPNDPRPALYHTQWTLKYGRVISNYFGPPDYDLKELKSLFLDLTPEQGEIVGLAFLAFERDIEKMRAKEHYAPPVLDAIWEAQKIFPVGD